MNGRSKVQRNQSPRERSELFVKRRNRQERINWRDVSGLKLRAALACCGDAGATISVAPALGGIGVTVRIYNGEKVDSEYAGSAREFDELMELIIEGYGSTSEDILMTLDKFGELRDTAQAAD